MSKLTFTKWVAAGLASASVIALIALPAFATPGQTSNCVVFDVGVDTNGSRLTFHCFNDANDYTAGYAGCAQPGIEAIKQWHSQAMAALLSGKKVSLWWDNACGKRAISGFVMYAQ